MRQALFQQRDLRPIQARFGGIAFGAGLQDAQRVGQAALQVVREFQVFLGFPDILIVI